MKRDPLTEPGGLPGNRLRRWAAACALSLALAPGGLWAQAQAQASRLYEDALRRFDQQDHKGAAVQLRNALQQDRNNLAVQVLLGRVLLADGDVVGAEVALGEALRLGVNRAEVVVPLAQAVIHQGRQPALLSEPRFELGGLPPAVQADLLLLRASALTDLGNTREGLQAVEQARALAPDRADSWLAEVPIRIRAGDLTAARNAADRALALAPDNAETLYVRGQVDHAGSNLDAALRWYAQALSQRPTHLEALVSRAGIWLDLGRVAEAQQDVSALLKTAPGEPRGAYLQAQLAERRGDAVAARAAYESVTNLLDPVPIEYLRYRPQLLMLAGLSHYSLQQYEKAGPFLELLQRLQPGSPVAKVMARIHLAQRNPERAVETLTSYLRGAPRDVQAGAMLADIQLSLGRHSRAVQAAQEALRHADEPQLRTLAGLGLLGLGRIPEAVQALEAALRSDPQQLRAATALVAVYQQSGQFARAGALAETLSQRQPRNPGAAYMLGQARAAEGNAAAARQAYERALQIDPAFSLAQVGLARLEIAAGALDAAAARLGPIVSRPIGPTMTAGTRGVQAATPPAGSLEAMIEMARIHELRSDLAEARRHLERADDLAGPNNIQAGLALVEFLLTHRQAEAARAALPRLTEKMPNALPVLVISARAHLALGDTAAARGALTRASTVAGFEVPSLLMIARLQMQAGHLPGASQSLGKVLSERPDDLPALVMMAELDLRQGEWARAEQTAQQIVTRHPRAGIGHALLGDVARARGQGATALERYRRAQQLEPTAAHLARLFDALSAQDPGAAQRLADDWLKRHPDDRAIRRAVADTLARQSAYPAARVHYEVLVRNDPTDAEALNNLANLLILQGDRGALAVAERALALRPGAAHVIGTTGWAAFKAGQTDRALQLLRDARLRDPANPATRYFLGSVLAEAGRAGEARTELQAALAGGGSAAPFAADARRRLESLP